MGSKETGSIKHIHFSNIIASSETGIVIYATAKNLIQDISFDDISLTIKRGKFSDSYGGNIDLRPTNDISLGIFEHPIPAVYGNFVSDLSIRNMNVYWEKVLPSYFNGTIEVKNFERIKIDGLHEESFNNNPVIYLHKGKDPEVKGVSSTMKNKKLVLSDDKD